MGSSDIDLKIVRNLVFFLAIYFFLVSAFMYDTYSADPRMQTIADGGALGFVTSAGLLMDMIGDGTIPFIIVGIFGAPMGLLLGLSVLRTLRN